MTAPVAWHEALGSTQDEAHRRASEGAPHGTAVAARVQTAGRGTRGRPWDAGDGGLWLSVIARPAGSAAVAVAGLRVGLAVAGLLEGLPGLHDPVGIKWPNDLYVRGRKLGGFLAEGRWQGERLQWMVIGAGINVRNRVAPPHQIAAIGLAELGADPDLAGLAAAVAAAIAGAALRDGPLAAEELAAFDRRDRLRGRPLAAPIEGFAEGISPLGRLRVRLRDGSVRETLDSPVLAGALE